MNEAALLEAAPGGTCIDHSRRFIAEECTPLFHTSVYRSLPETQRLRYNQLHALYFNEQVAFFEQEMLSPALHALMNGPLPAGLGDKLQAFFDEEQHHTAMFRTLNRRAAPGLYEENSYHFIRVTKPSRLLLAAISRRPRLFPLLLWLALLQEERSLYYSKRCLSVGADLEPHFVTTHRAHLADEVGHIGWDEELLDWFWPRTGRVLRQANVRLLAWMLGEFFLLPKRSGVRVVAELAGEFPDCDPAALHRGLLELHSHPKYLQSLYSREVTPRAFAHFDRYPEFALLGRVLPGYRPPGSAFQ